jgi:hypothetical protein
MATGRTRSTSSMTLSSGPIGHGAGALQRTAALSHGRAGPSQPATLGIAPDLEIIPNRQHAVFMSDGEAGQPIVVGGCAPTASARVTNGVIDGQNHANRSFIEPGTLLRPVVLGQHC